MDTKQRERSGMFLCHEGGNSGGGGESVERKNGAVTGGATNSTSITLGRSSSLNPSSPNFRCGANSCRGTFRVNSRISKPLIIPMLSLSLLLSLSLSLFSVSLKLRFRPKLADGCVMVVEPFLWGEW